MKIRNVYEKKHLVFIPCTRITSLNVNKSRFIRLFSACLMLIFGAWIYIISRNDIIFMDLMPPEMIEILKITSINTSSYLGYFISFCLPDGLWYGALLLFQDSIAIKSSDSKTVFWASAVLPFVLELLQCVKFVPGTFDIFDLMTYTIVLAIYLHLRYST